VNGDPPALVDVDELADVTEAPLPANQDLPELVVPDENSLDIGLRLGLPALGGLFRHRALEDRCTYLRADRRRAGYWSVFHVECRAHNDSFSLTSKTSSELARHGASECAPIGGSVKYAKVLALD
jgi:hypothetical protein